MDRDWLFRALNKINESIHEQEEHLTELDQAIGDGDHGRNMARGFQAVAEKLPQLQEKDIASLLKTVGMTLVSTVGGASGPLYGTAFMKAGGALAGHESFGREEMQIFLDEAVGGIQMRGKAQKGEKTILDALIPAQEAFRASPGEMREALTQAVEAAKEGVEYTKTIVASKGRASYLGERSLGHQDPGATSCLVILRALLETL